jgi:protein tyrosine phosphatase type 4A
MLNKPSLVEHNNYRFMIFSAPDDNSLQYWIEQFKLYNVTDVVRTCERTYTEDDIIKEGIKIHDMRFDDGKFPSKEIVKNFLDIVEGVFAKDIKENQIEEKCVAVHCIAGLGR